MWRMFQKSDPGREAYKKTVPAGAGSIPGQNALDCVRQSPRWDKEEHVMQEHKEWPEIMGTMIGDKRITLGEYTTFNFLNDPKRFGFVLARYKFAAKMIGQKCVMELGCADGVGTYLLSKECGYAAGVDYHQDSIDRAVEVFGGYDCQFCCIDFMGNNDDIYLLENVDCQAVVSMDVIEHIPYFDIDKYWQAVISRLPENGVAVIGTPSAISQHYASPISKAGHINIYEHERFVAEAERYFHNVFLFSMHDEIVHTGFYPLAHYLIALCVGPK